MPTAIAQARDALSEWGGAVTRRAIPDEVCRRAALVLLDDFAAMVAARNEPELIALRDGVAEATVFDGPRRRLGAIRWRCPTVRWRTGATSTGGYRPAACHAASYCLPALLAEAEATCASLRDVLLALLVTARLNWVF